jgi:hypothetical protein
MSTRWTQAADAQLKEFYDHDFTDAEMAKAFNTTVFAIAKRRSVLGYCKTRRAFSHRRPKRVINVDTEYVAMYRKDGRQHISFLSNNREQALRMARTLADKQLLREIYVLTPKYNVKRLTGKIIEYSQ